MQPRTHSQLFEFPVDEALDRFGRSGLSELQLLAEYNAEQYEDLYVAESVVERLGGLEAYERRRDVVADFLRLDLLERDAYVDLVPRAGRVELLITQAANLLLIRAFRADDALFVSVDRNGSIDEFVGIVEALVDDE